MAVTASDARQRLFPLIRQVNEDHQAIEIISKGGSAMLISKDDYDALVETVYLFSTPANARNLLDSIESARLGRTEEHALLDGP